MTTTEILLIEDNPDDVLLIREMISEAGKTRYRLECANTLAGGLERLAEAPPHIVLLDLGLPDSRGLDTFVVIHTVAPNVPVVVLTGLEDEAMGIQVMKLSAQDCLFKGKVDSYLLTRAIRYAMERQFLEGELSQVISNNRDAIIVADGEGMVRLVNPSAEALFGRDSDSIVGSLFGFPLVGMETTELDVVTQSGEQRIVEMCVAETTWEGKPAFLASIRDITERNKMIEALEEANRKIHEQQERLMEEERLKVMLQMAGATAHELNQPLCGLLGNVELLEISSDDPKLFSECLRDIKTSGRRIADTVKKIQNIHYYETKPYAKNGVIIDIDQDVHMGPGEKSG